jgi:hypothetical protein
MSGGSFVYVCRFAVAGATQLVNLHRDNTARALRFRFGEAFAGLPDQIGRRLVVMQLGHGGTERYWEAPRFMDNRVMLLFFTQRTPRTPRLRTWFDCAYFPLLAITLGVLRVLCAKNNPTPKPSAHLSNRQDIIFDYQSVVQLRIRKKLFRLLR